MLEELCSSGLWNACNAIRDRTPMIRLRGSNAMIYSDWDNFFCGADFHLRYDILPPLGGHNAFGRKQKDDPARSAWPWFSTNQERIIDGYLRAKYGNDLRRAMLEAGTYNALHEDWLSFFGERRRKFLEDEKMLVETAKTKLAKQGSKPASHGGVANLLRVLTKTMKEQGASVLSIAKMQYAVCVQAGIMLPNEFLTDVLVADQIMNGGDTK